jgi:hypothetical protein
VLPELLEVPAVVVVPEPDVELALVELRPVVLPLVVDDEEELADETLLPAELPLVPTRIGCGGLHPVPMVATA